MSARLLSPMKRRIYPNARTGTSIKTAGSLVTKQRDGHREGEAERTLIITIPVDVHGFTKEHQA